MREKPRELIEELRFVLNSREDFEITRAALARASPMSDVQRAACFYQLIRYSYASGLTSYAYVASYAYAARDIHGDIYEEKDRNPLTEAQKAEIRAEIEYCPHQVTSENAELHLPDLHTKYLERGVMLSFSYQPRFTPTPDTPESLTELEKLKNAALLIEDMTGCRWRHSSGGAFIYPDTDEYLAINMGRECDYADLNPVVGSEQGGVRPVLVLQNNVGNRHSPTVIVAAITSRIGKPRLPTHVPIGGAVGGLRKDSVVLMEQVRTIDRSRLREFVGRLARQDTTRTGSGEWRRSTALKIQLRWEYLEYLDEPQTTFAIKYDTEVDAIFSFNHTCTDIIGMYDRRRAGASITETIQDICAFAHSRY